MHRHQLHGVLPGLRLVVAGLQRGVREESRQRRQGLAGFCVGRQRSGSGSLPSGADGSSPWLAGDCDEPRPSSSTGSATASRPKPSCVTKDLGRVDQFVQILEPVLAFVLGLVVLFEPAVLQHQLDDLAQAQARRLLAQHVDLGDEGAEVGAGLAGARRSPRRAASSRPRAPRPAAARCCARRCRAAGS